MLVVVTASALFAGAAWTAISLLWPGPASATTWYVLGAVHVALLGIVLHQLEAGFVAHEREAMQHVRGAWGEENTRDELAAAKRRRLIWGWVDSVETSGGDLDHFVVTRRGGLVVMDSKFRTHVGPGHADEMARTAHHARIRAEGVARTVLGGRERAKRRARGDVAVTPVVVVWGAAQSTLPPGGVEVDGVRFLAGRGLRPWLRGLDGEIVDEPSARALIHGLEEFRSRAAVASA